MAPICDESLRPIQHPRVASLHRSRPRSARIRTRSRLRQAPRAQPMPTRQLRNPPLPLLIIPRQHNVIRAQRIMRRHDDPHAAIHPRQLLDCEHIFHVAHARAAQRLRKDHTQQPHLSQLLHDLVRKLALLIPLAHMRRNLPLGKRAHRTLQLLLFFRQSKHFLTPGSHNPHLYIYHIHAYSGTAAQQDLSNKIEFLNIEEKLSS